MSPEAYLQMAEVEAKHWWYRARRDILREVLAHLELPMDSRVLEIGSGTGGNLGMLEQFGQVSGLEMDDVARDVANRKTGWRFDLRSGGCPDDLPFCGKHFDLICLFHCLELVDDDREALRRTGELLAPDGVIVVTVPAFQYLWSAHDASLGCRRHYDCASLALCAHEAGYELQMLSYFGALLFPFVAATRIVHRALHRAYATHDTMAGPVVNRMLYRIARAERRWVPEHGLPFGVSLLAVLRKESS